MVKDKDLKLDEIHENEQLQLGMGEPEALHHLLFLSDLFRALFYLPAFQSCFSFKLPADAV